MRHALLAIAFVLSPAAVLWAQESPGIEIGTRVGLNVILDGEDIVNFAVPGGAPSPLGSLFGGNTSVHVAFFAGEQFMIETQLSVSILNISGPFEDETIGASTLVGQGAYLFSGATANSFYLGASAGFFSIDFDGASENDLAFGGSVGYRLLPKENIALRFEGAYRRWLDFEINELDFAVILGVLF